MGKFIVIKDLVNIRNRPLIKDETFVGTLRMGEEIDLLDETIAGDTPDGTDDNLWHSDSLNRFVSKPAVAAAGTYAAKKAAFIADKFNEPFIDVSDKENESKWKVSWGHVDLEIWRIWKEFDTMGEDVRVAVIDTGVISENNDLKDRISPLSISVANNSLTDNNGIHHGTMSAGLIGANGNNCNTVYGIAPKCELLIIKAGENAFIPANLLKAIRKAIELKANIISLSIEAYKSTIDQDPNTFKEIEKLIFSCKLTGPLFIAAVGDRGSTSVSYPASFDGCFSVAAYSLNNQKEKILHPSNNRNQFIKFLCPGNQILTCSNTSTPSFYDESSAATAFASGLFALIKSAVKKETSINYSAIDSLIQTKNFTEQLLDEPIPSEKEGYGILSGIKLINILNS